MERRTVFLAAVGALSVVACGGEAGEEFGETQQAVSFSITPSLPILGITISGSAPGSQIKLTVKQVPALWLKTITLTKGAPGVPTTGLYWRGGARKLGTATATISAEEYDAIVSLNASGFHLAVSLMYTESGTVHEVFIDIL